MQITGKFSSRFCLPIYYYIKRSQINTIWSYLLFAHISLTCHLMINSLYSLLLLDIQKVFIIVFFMMKLFYVYLLGCCRAMAVWKSVVTGKILQIAISVENRIWLFTSSAKTWVCSLKLQAVEFPPMREWWLVLCGYLPVCAYSVCGWRMGIA